MQKEKKPAAAKTYSQNKSEKLKKALRDNLKRRKKATKS